MDHVLIHPDIDRDAVLIGHKARGDYEIAVWADGLVTKRFANGRTIQWNPPKGAAGFMTDNRSIQPVMLHNTIRVYGPKRKPAPRGRHIGKQSG